MFLKKIKLTVSKVQKDVFAVTKQKEISTQRTRVHVSERVFIHNNSIDGRPVLTPVCSFDVPTVRPDWTIF